MFRYNTVSFKRIFQNVRVKRSDFVYIGGESLHLRCKAFIPLFKLRKVIQIYYRKFGKYERTDTQKNINKAHLKKYFVVYCILYSYSLFSLHTYLYIFIHIIYIITCYNIHYIYACYIYTVKLAPTHLSLTSKKYPNIFSG